MCRCGDSQELELHVLTSCPFYKNIREKYGDLEDDGILAAFFGEALARREEYDKEQEAVGG